MKRIYEITNWSEHRSCPLPAPAARRSFQCFVQVGNVSDESGHSQRSDDDSRRVMQDRAVPVRDREYITDHGGALFSGARYWENLNRLVDFLTSSL